MGEETRGMEYCDNIKIVYDSFGLYQIQCTSSNIQADTLTGGWVMDSNTYIFHMIIGSAKE